MANVPLRPAGNFYGMFYRPKTPSGGPDPWASYPMKNFDLAGDWQNQIDLTKSIGGNFFAFFVTSMEYITDGSGYVRATMVSQLKQIMDYALKKRIYVLPYMCTTYSQWGTTTNTQATAEMVAWAQLFAVYPNVVGIATVDEPLVTASLATTTANAAVQYAALKAVLPSDIGVCAGVCGNFLQSGGGAPTNPFDVSGTYGTNLAALAPYCDLFIFHPFVAVSSGNLTALVAAYPGKDIILPSSVLSDQGDADIATKTASIMGLPTSVPAVRGNGQFLIKDFPYQTGSAPYYGVFDENGTERSTKTTAFRAGIAAPLPQIPRRVFPGAASMNQRMQLGYK